MPTDWEDRYQLQDTPWDRGAPAPPLEDFLAAHVIQGSVLVPGCGTGHDVRLLASCGAEVVGLDVAPSALKRARTYPPAGKEEYVLADLFDLPSSFAGRFDWVVEHTCFCAIDPELRHAYVQAVARVLKPGGQILGIFYTDPEAEGGPPFMTSREELWRLFDSRFELLEEWQPARCFAGRENCEWVRWMRRRPSDRGDEHSLKAS